MTQIIQRSFTSGEIAPALRSRADLSKYATGLALCQNGFIRSQGGWYSRPGLRFVGEVGDSSTTARLIPFSFNTEQTYTLVFQNLTMRVIKDGAFVLAGGGPAVFELVTPYTEAQLSRLSYTQSADVMTIAHPDHDDSDLSRTADDAWTLVANNYASTVTAPTGLASVAVGAGAGTNSKTYRYVVTAVDAGGVESLASVETSITTGSLSVTAGVKITWTVVAGAEYYRVYKDPSDNSGFHGWIGDSTNAEFSDFNLAPITSDAPPEDRQPFTGADNKPAVVGYYQQRRVYANTNNEPQAVFTTQIGNFKSLRTSNPSRDDDAITFTIAAQQVNEIRHIVAIDSMILLTSGGAWKVTEGQDQVFTPSTAGVRIQSYNGASWVKPAVVNDTAIYLQEKGARVRDLNYKFANDRFSGDDLSIMSEHLLEDKQIVEMAYAEEPYGILWFIRDDGVMLGMTYQNEHQVVGWHQHITDGEFESIATISEDDRDAVYVVVKRTINGSDVRYVERLEKRTTSTAENSFFVDSGLTLDVPSTVTGATQANPVVITDNGHPYSNGDLVDLRDIVGMTELNNNQYMIANITANTYELTHRTSGVNTDGTGFTAYVSGGTSREAVVSISGLDHLEGKAVAVLANGNVVNDLSVVSGAITLPRAASIVHVGLAYLPAMETLDIEPSAKVTETVKAKEVSVSKVVMEVEKSRGGWVGPKNDDESTGVMYEIKPRSQVDGYGSLPLRTYKSDVTIDPMWGKGGGIRIEQRDPLPLAVLSVIPDVDVGGK